MGQFFQQNPRVAIKNSYFFTPKMQQLAQIMESPSEELYGLLEKEVEKNPFLYWKTRTKALLIEKKALYPNSFSEHISLQIRQQIPSKEQKIAFEILYDLDERGYYTKPLDQLNTLAQSVRKKLLWLDPVGVASSSLQECLLIQLESRKKTQSLSYYILHNHFQDFLHQRFALLARKVKCSPTILEKDIEEHVKELYTRPRSFFDHAPNSIITPDILITSDSIRIDPHIPPLFVEIPEKSNRFSRYWCREAAFLENYLEKRSALLLKVMHLILRVQKGFFQYQQPLVSLSIQDAAQSLQIHPATLRRILAHKYVCFDGEMFLLRYFFSRDTKGFSQKKVSYLLTQIVAKENKCSPLSDEQIAENLAKKGCYLSRRTVAKYRKQLHIPKKIQRKRQKSTETEQKTS